MIKRKWRKTTIAAWLLAGMALAGGLISLNNALAAEDVPDLGDILIGANFELILPLLYGGLGALIVSRQATNTVGWLMLLAAQDLGGILTLFVGPLVEPPLALTPGLWLALWFDNFSWILFIFPIFLIPLHFPDGRPPSHRWNWVNLLAVGLWLFLAAVGSFAAEIGPIDGEWAVPNPLGLLPADFFNGSFLVLWGIGLLTIVGGSVSSLFVRYRRSGPSERDQIKWLLLAGGIFFVSYGLSYFLVGDHSSDSAWSSALFTLSLTVFPVAISIAILRHRLYDINLIIRRTLQYSIVTALLALIYFGGIVLLQGIVGTLTGNPDSPIVTVVTTLAIAALFNRLRSRVQTLIDMRFFRAKYDAEQVMAGFAQTVRNEVDLDKLADSLLHVVGQTFRPEQSSLWLHQVRGHLPAPGTVAYMAAAPTRPPRPSAPPRPSSPGSAGRGTASSS